MVQKIEKPRLQCPVKGMYTFTTCKTQPAPVFRIHDIWCGSGSADPCLRLMDPDSDPDPAIFITDLQDVKKKLILSFSAYDFLKAHVHHFSKIKSPQEA